MQKPAGLSDTMNHTVVPRSKVREKQRAPTKRRLQAMDFDAQF
jgi:hypothetical protein